MRAARAIWPIFPGLMVTCWRACQPRMGTYIGCQSGIDVYYLTLDGRTYTDQSQGM